MNPKAMIQPSFRLTLSCTLAVIYLAALGLLSGQTPGLNNPTPFVAYSNGILPSAAPGSSTGWDAVDAFPNLQFIDPLWLAQVPGTSSLPSDLGELVVVGKNGQIWRFDANDPDVAQGEVVQVLDWSAHTQTGEDMGFYSLVFHPNFGQSGQIGEDDVFVCYNHRPGLSGQGVNDTYWRVSRFKWDFGTGTIDLTSNVGGPGEPEEVLIDQYDPQQWHNGGAMFFDNEGFLNISCGDGEFDYWHQDQNGPIDGGFFGGVFRIDVDYVEALAANPSYNKSHAIRRQPQDIPGGYAPPTGWPASSTQGYGIPETNPWLDPGGSILEEFIVHGLRSPHTAHYDPVLNEIWVGDVGGGGREELSRLVVGDNGQWPIKEGINGGNEPAGAIGTWTDPVYDYGHGGADQYGVRGNCIIGGMRYRGAKWSGSLSGDSVIFGDITTGKVWALKLDGSDNFDSVSLLYEGIKPGGKQGIGNFFTDDAGEIYLMELNGTNNNGGKIKKLVTQGIANEPPQFLSQTGLFSNVATLTPAAGVIPYDVATPLWSDAAHKKRWIALPNDGTHDTAAEKIAFNEEYNWVFPAGTVLIKHFELDADLDPGVEVIKRLETRLIVCTANGGKYGVTYKWNEAGTDAELLTTGESELITVTEENDSTSVQNWNYPSRADCLQCHNTAAGQALGVRTTALNMDHFYPSTGRVSNQLLTFNSLGMFDRTLTATQLANFIESRAIDDESAPVEHRVRSYLDSNCSHCHQTGGVVDYFDARLGTPLNKQGLVNGFIQGHFELPGGNYIKPGDTSLSAVFVRAHAVGNGDAMPPLAKNLIDQKAVDLIEDYILGLNAAEFQPAPNHVEARYVRLTGLDAANGSPYAGAAEFTILDQTGALITTGVTVSDFDSEEATGEGANNGHAIHAIDNNPNTFWHTEWQAADPPYPHHITLDLGSVRGIGGYHYVPRQGNGNTRIGQYQVHYSNDGTNWTLMDSGDWPNNADTKVFDDLVGIRKVRCEIAGPLGTLTGPFEITVAFDHDVTDFSMGDLDVTGGNVTALRGSGYYYVATIDPTDSAVTVQVPTDVVNSTLVGSLASNTLNLGEDIYGPVATFTNLPSGRVWGPLVLDIEFDEEPFGLSAASLSATNATVSGLSGSGTTYSVVVSPIAEGPLSVTLGTSGITDTLGNPMGAPAIANLTFAVGSLHAEAEGGAPFGGMAIVNDGTASGGQYLWLPEGSAPGNEGNFNTTNGSSYSFSVPHDGNWILEGLVQADGPESDSFWVRIDGGDVYTWDIDEGISGWQWDQLNHTVEGSSGGGGGGGITVLIDATTNNGSFEYAGGVLNTAKLNQWDGTPDVDNWTLWGASVGGPSTTSGNSGVESTGNQTDGTMVAFLQANNAIYNLTSHVAAEGDLLTFSWDHVLRNSSHTVSLVYQDASGDIVSIVASEVTSTTVGTGLGMAYTIPTGSPAIGRPIGIGVRNNNSNWPEVDNFVLTLGEPSAPPATPNILIDATTNNGSFELLGGTGRTAKATHWDTDPDGNVDNWTYLSGPANDSGTEVNGDATDGARIAFFQGGNSAYNETTHLIAEGEQYTYSWDYTLAGRGNVTAQLAYKDVGNNIIPITGTETTNPNNTTAHPGLGSGWQVPPGHASIGRPMVFLFTSSGYYPHVDNVELSYIQETVVIDPLVLALAAGTHTVEVFAREDGALLDALRLVSERPFVTLTAPATAAGGDFTVDVDFSESVTDLAAGDFTVTGATVGPLTGSGSAYSLTVIPTGSTVTVFLPSDSAADGDGDLNFASNLTVTSVTSASLLEQWADANGLGTVSATDDTNGDGITVLEEFLLNLDPNTYSDVVFDPDKGLFGLPRVTLVDAGGGNRRFRVELPRNADAEAEGYQYFAQFSDDLENWDTVSAPAPAGNGWDHVIIDDIETTATKPRRFARVMLLAP